uniref:hypothetical protein n=1 Tax=Flavobacterium sp. TaxID=239 RepID=UPI00404AF764
MAAKLTLPETHVLPDSVVAHLQFLTTQPVVAALYLSTILGSQRPCVLVLLNQTGLVQTWRSQKWIQRAFDNHALTFLILGPSEINSHVKKGTAFLALHARPEKALYVAESYEVPHATTPTLKRLKKLQAQFYQEIDVLTTQINVAKKAASYQTVFDVYRTLYGHYFFYFEWLLFGSISNQADLHSRLLRLTTYLPALQRAFVKLKPHQFYLIDVLLRATNPAQDVSLLPIEMLPAIQNNEKLLDETLHGLFQKLKKVVKKKVSNPQVQTPKIVYDCADALALVAKNPKVETIYAYEKRDLVNAHGVKQSVRYWLVVGDGIDHSQLMNWHDAVLTQTKGAVVLVPVAHSRIWIQKNLYAQQHFFQKVMTKTNHIYQRDAFDPTIHWEDPYEALYPDLDYYRAGCLELGARYRALRSVAVGGSKTGMEGLGLLLSALVMRSCRVIVYAKLGYLPHYLPVRLLWLLAELSDVRIYHLHFLTDQLSVDWLGFIARHQHVFHSAEQVQEGDWLLMDGLVEGLIERLNG